MTPRQPRLPPICGTTGGRCRRAVIIPPPLPLLLPVLLLLVLLLASPTPALSLSMWPEGGREGGGFVDPTRKNRPPPPSSSSSSPLAGTEWSVRLDVGLQPGTWMPRRYPGWAESGARLGLAATVRFTPEPSPRGEALVGSLTDTYRVEVTSGPARLVTEGGEETVELNGGGWCIQRPTAGVRNAEGGLVRPEGLLRFWLDCPGGARRRDVVVPPGTRIYCTTGVWDDPDASREAGREYGRVVKELEEIREAALAGRERGREQSALEYLGTFGRLFGQSRRYDSLDQRRREYEQQLPPPSAPQAGNGVRIAPNGSLVIKGNGTPDWMPGSEYLILGTFTTSLAG